jgi:hypothetical protein
MRNSLLLAMLGVLALSGQMNAQPPDKKPAGEGVDWTAKRIPFEVRGAPWGKVFEWLADEAKMPYASQYPPPPGTFTFINPKDGTGKPRLYSLLEAYDIINENLQTTQKHILFRRKSTLTMFPADAQLDGLLGPFLVPLKDLPERGESEVVRIVLTARNVSAEEFARKAQTILGDFGRATVLDDQKVLVRGPVRALRVIIDAFADDLNPKAQATTPPASPPPPAAARYESARRWRPLIRLLRR